MGGRKCLCQDQVGLLKGEELGKERRAAAHRPRARVEKISDGLARGDELG